MAERGELAHFLRSRRERLTPDEVGLPSAGRRRTPGLRREEVATLAGLSIDYLVRLEQGRDTNPSAAVLAALADALRLSEAEKRHLAFLAVKTSNAELCPEVRALTDDLRPGVRMLLEGLDPTPAFVVGPINDVVAWNHAWATLAAPLGMLEAEPPNLARYVFRHPAAQRVLHDWGLVADEQTARLRTAQTHWGSDDRFVALIDELHANPEFSRRWDTHDVAAPPRGVRRIEHPDAGALRITCEALAIEDADQRLLSWLPHDEHTADAIRTLLAAPLHVVRHA